MSFSKRPRIEWSAVGADPILEIQRPARDRLTHVPQGRLRRIPDGELVIGSQGKCPAEEVRNCVTEPQPFCLGKPVPTQEDWEAMILARQLFFLALSGPN